MKIAPKLSVLKMMGSLTDIPRVTSRDFTNLISFNSYDMATYLASLLDKVTPFWPFDPK
jgi:hypothetical protein